MTKIDGVCTALITPFNDDYSVDYRGLGILIEYQLNNNINQFVVCGSTGEGTLLTLEERKAVIKKSIEIVNKNGITGVGCSASSTSEAINLVLMAQEYKADFALVAPPYYIKPTQDGIVNFYREISSKTELPIVAYNIPSRVCVSINFESLLKILQISNVIGLKEAALNFGTISRLSIVTDSKFNILSGDDLTFPASLLYGTCGSISAIANYCPKVISDFYKTWQSGKIDTKLVQKIVEISRASSVASNPIALKYMMSKKGLVKNVLRHPLLPLDKEKIKIVDSILDVIEQV